MRYPAYLSRRVLAAIAAAIRNNPARRAAARDLDDYWRIVAAREKAA